MSTSEGEDGLGRHRLGAVPAVLHEYKTARLVGPAEPCRHDDGRGEDRCGLCSPDRASEIEARLRSNVSMDEEPTYFNWVGLLAMVLSSLLVIGCAYGSIRAVLSQLHG